MFKEGRRGERKREGGKEGVKWKGEGQEKTEEGEKKGRF